MATDSIDRTVSNSPEAPCEKVQVKLERISPGTIWKQAKIEIIDSLSAFYVKNYEPAIYERFTRMLNDLHNYYNRLELLNALVPVENISIGDCGVVKYSKDDRWYRARILMAEDMYHIKIVYIDFGNIETIHAYEFFPLDKAFTDLPAQAIVCSLSEAFPPTLSDSSPLWPMEMIRIFHDEVAEKFVEITFVNSEEGAKQWPLHFVRITIGDQTIPNSLSLKQRIKPTSNCFIAEQLANYFSLPEYILFNVPFYVSDE